MQLEMSFDPERDDGEAAMTADGVTHPRTADAGAPGPVGVFTGRPWRRIGDVPGEIIARLRRSLPLDIPVSDRLLQILASRGLVESAALEQFFYPELEQLSDPFLLREMRTAADRLLRAAGGGEKVAVHGDFDVDGITGCALLMELLQNLRVDGRRAVPQPGFIPDRARDGYGVAGWMIERWAEDGVRLLLTVDTGAAAHEEIVKARELGIDVVVLDHHVFQERPPAMAVVNPRRQDALYPNGDLCGVAVAFKFVQALRRIAPDCLPPEFERSVLDLVALGLIADQMPLVGENRILVRKGMARLAERQSMRPGLAALLSVAGLDHGLPLTTTDLAYQVAPRLNACGRVGRVMTALELLLTRDPDQARELAAEADRTNQLRKQADLALKEEAAAMAAPYLERGDQGLVLASENWHKGVIGIGAARLVEQFQVPTILIAVEGDEARGSARSVAEIDVKEVLDVCAPLLVRYGGHTQAAGLTIRSRDIEALRERFLEALASLPAGGPVPEPYDLDLPLQELTAADVLASLGELEHLEPLGAGNPRPVFRCDGLELLRPPQEIGGGAHLRFAFRSPSRPPAGGSPALLREFVAFGCGEAWRRMHAEMRAAGVDPLRGRWDILFNLSRSTFRPRSGMYDPVQQQLVDIRPTATS